MSAGRITLRRRGLSLRIDLRSVLLCGALLAVALVALVLSVALGELRVPFADAVRSIFGAGNPATDFIVRDLRLPRAVTALFAGAALGLAGAVFQEVTRNPLVSPDIVGVSGGASLAAITVIVFTSADGPLAVPLAALVGALLSGAALFGLAWQNGVHGYRIVLVGIGLSALTTAGISYVLTEGRIFEVAEAYVWMVGTVNGRDWSQVLPLAIACGVLFPLAMVVARRLDVLALGDDLARSLGVDASRIRAGLLALAVALTGAAVSAAGPIGFVAFMAPHVGRRLVRSSSAQSLLPVAAGCGAVLVLVADLSARLMFAPTEVPVGLVTSIIAAPYFLLLLRRAGRLGAAG
ncbi:MAG: iron ABC transporter permease [Patulibacter minatonensis]